ncbi:MAG: DUF488 family protein [Gammaproteobacteria bacterium]|nr:DUF488 family protein [Gammaproteobacteria bacterium]
MSQKTLYTIGHSTHKITEFVALLGMHEIEAIADIRSAPYSRYNPQFNKDELQQSLKESGIAYVYLGKELGHDVKNRNAGVTEKLIIAW